MAEKLSLGGREYVRAGPTTVRLDLFVMQHARHAGLGPICEGETPEAYMERLLSSCLSSGRALLLLGALLWPAGTKPEQWDEDLAYATAGHLGGLEDPVEKAKVYEQVANLLLDFFAEGLGSWVASVRSSAAAASPPAASSSSTGATVSGRPSSEPSPATTTTAPSSSSPGPSTRPSAPTGGGSGATPPTATATSN